MYKELRFSKLLLIALAVGCAVYCLVALSYIATTPDIGLRCLLAEDSQEVRQAGELTLVQSDVRTDSPAELPQIGDRIHEVAGFRTRTFVDFANALAWVRSPPRDAAKGTLTPGIHPRDVPAGSTNVLQDDDSTG